MQKRHEVAFFIALQSRWLLAHLSTVLPHRQRHSRIAALFGQRSQG
jgi:hypothetical protein